VLLALPLSAFSPLLSPSPLSFWTAPHRVLTLALLQDLEGQIWRPEEDAVRMVQSDDGEREVRDCMTVAEAAHAMALVWV
jgi:hypothetical protein